MTVKWRTIPGFVQIGRTGTTHGTEGALKIRLEEPFLRSVFKADFLFVELAGDKVPYRVEGWYETRDLLVKFDSVDNSTDASALVGKGVFLPSDEVEERSDDERPGMVYAGLEGFEMHDARLGHVGRIQSVVEYPQQEMAIVEYGEGQRLVPLNDQFVERVDSAARIVYMELPEGLLDLE